MRANSIPARVDGSTATLPMNPCVTPGWRVQRTVSMLAAERMIREASLRAERLAWDVRLRGGCPNPLAGVSGLIIPIALVLAKMVWDSGRAYTRLALARLS